MSEPNQDDAERLAAWGEGDVSAGEALFESHFSDLFRFFFTKIPDAAQDLTQETLLACVKQRDRLADIRSFRAYLFGIARNQLWMELRRRARAPQLARLSELSLADLAPSPSSVMVREERRGSLLEAIRCLRVDVQTTLELYYWQGASTEEIAEITGVEVGTVRSRLARAREALGAHVEEAELRELGRQLS